MLSTDQKFANLISYKLTQFKWTDQYTANFRCPLCGDSKKNKFKKRGYFYEEGGKMFMKCHNCTESMSIGKFIQKVDQDLYSQYNLENFRDKGHTTWNTAAPKQKTIFATAKENTSVDLVSIEDLPHDHMARIYIENRKIPKQFLTKLFYTENYKKYINEKVIPGKFDKVEKSDQRIVIVFYDIKGNIYAYQGRSLRNREPRYITIFPDKEGKTLIYGLERVNFKEEIRLVEGPFDSMFINNCLAVAGSSLAKMVNFDKLDLLYIFDNEPRSDEICAIMEKVIDAGKKIVIYPKDLSLKDINDMYLAGMDIEELIKNNTYSGLMARLKYNQWKKI